MSRPAVEQVVDAIAFKVNLALVGRVERGEEMQQRALATTAGSDDGDELAFANGELDALEHGNLQRALAVALADAVRAEKRCWGGSGCMMP